MSLEGQSQNDLSTSDSKTAVETPENDHGKQQASNSISRDEDLLRLSATEHKDSSDEGKLEREPKLEDGAVDASYSKTDEGHETYQEPNIDEGPLKTDSETQLQNLTISATTTSPGPQGELQHFDPSDVQPAETMAQDYLDPTPKTPRQEVSPSRHPLDDSKDGNPDSEIQSIMHQFEKDNAEREEGGGEREQQWVAAEAQLSVSNLQHPPRRSSLIPVEAVKHEPEPVDSVVDATNEKSQIGAKEAVLPNRNSSLPQTARPSLTQDAALKSPTSTISLPKALPLAPDPDSDLPFDFHRFLEQLRDKSADPVAKYLRSFLIEFGRKQWMVHEQVKLINDFLTFITNKMGRCAVWRDVSDAEFDNAKEGMEKLVMNRLYTQTFSPAIPPPTPTPMTKGKKKTIDKQLEPGRRGQHQEDIERDEILGQKIKIYGWVQEDHLDIPRIGENGRKFLLLAQQELLKIKSYRAPRDKVICVLNSCKVIFGSLRTSKTLDTSADSFVPLLIYVVLHANPDHLVSNVQYILRFRNQDKLGGEAGYYLSSLMGAIQFIENLDRTNLTVSDQDFETNVEAAVSIIAEKNRDQASLTASSKRQPAKGPTASHLSEKSGPSMPEVIPRNSIDAEYSSPYKTGFTRGRPGETGKSEQDDNTAVSGLLRTIQKPLSSIGRMFTDDPGSGPNSNHSRLPVDSRSPPRLSPALFQPPRLSEDPDSPNERPSAQPSNDQPSNKYPTSVRTGEREGKLSVEDAASRQANAEAVEAQRIERAEHHNIVETLAGMFPDLDKDIIDDVVRQKQGRVGLAVDACLTLNN